MSPMKSDPPTHLKRFLRREPIFTPPALMPHGKLYTALEDATDSFPAGSPEATATSGMMTEFRRLATVYQRGANGSEDDKQANAAFSQAVTRDTCLKQGCPEAVIRGLLLREMFPGLKYVFDGTTCVHLSERHQMYHAIFGSLLPADITSVAKQQVSNPQINTSEQAAATFVLDDFAAQTRPPPSILTRFPSLDALTGGFRDLVLVAGRTRSGTSTFLQNVILRGLAADPELAVLLVATEDSQDDVFRGFLAQASGVAKADFVIAAGDRELKHRLLEARSMLKLYLERFKVLSPLATRPQLPNADGDPGTDLLVIDEVNTLLKGPRVRRLLIVIDSLNSTAFLERGVFGEMAVTREVVSNRTGSVTNVIKLKMLREVLVKVNAGPVLVSIVVVANLPYSYSLVDAFDPDDRDDRRLNFYASQVLCVHRGVETTDACVTLTKVSVAKVRDYGAVGEVFMHHHFRRAWFEEAPAGPSSQASCEANSARNV